jgi:hypothetical protein
MTYIGTDQLEQARADFARQAGDRARAHTERVQRLTRILLQLGADAPAVLADTRALEEAAAAASDSWSKLGDLEGQILRECERLALLEAGLRATQEVKAIESSDDLRRADERREFVAKVESARASVAALTEQAKTDRRELERLTKRR